MALLKRKKQNTLEKPSTHEVRTLGADELRAELTMQQTRLAAIVKQIDDTINRHRAGSMNLHDYEETMDRLNSTKQIVEANIADIELVLSRDEELGAVAINNILD